MIEAASCSNSNPLFCETMQDSSVMIDSFGGDSKRGFFAIYDGHGGTQTVDFVSRHLHEKILSNIKSSKIDENTQQYAEECFGNAYSETDQILLEHEFQSGATAVTVLVRQDEKGCNYLYVANTGNSRALLWYSFFQIILFHCLFFSKLCFIVFKSNIQI